MAESATPEHQSNEPAWVSRLVAAEPRLPLMGPYMAYLLMMFFVDALPKGDIFRHLGIAMHIVGAAWAAWIMRRQWPAMGKWHVLIAIPAGCFAAWMWVAVQHGLEEVTVGGMSLGGTLGLDSAFPFVKLTAVDPAKIVIVPTEFADRSSFLIHAVLKITRAVTVVPIVEELFWRGFILRAFIDWDRFEVVPLAKFTLVSFLGSSFLSVLQHPAQWGASILCWMFFNVLFYRTASLRCLILVHGVTNLALYLYVIQSGDWQFW